MGRHTRSTQADLSWRPEDFEPEVFRCGPRGICLLDLDTIGPQTLAAEMGDAWRSWCNPAKEDEPEHARFDLTIFEASAKQYLKWLPEITPSEKKSRLYQVSFAYALNSQHGSAPTPCKNSYFKEDRLRYPVPGQHNLLKAQSQLLLAKLAQRKAAENIIVKS